MFEARILQLQDAQAIIDYEKKRLADFYSDEVENELKSWSASWRPESLNHYIPLGWSFALWSQEGRALVGYFIAQPQLFVTKLTQTLWIERLVGDTPMIASELIDIAYRMSREKHFQRILFHIQEDMNMSQSVFQLSALSDQIFELKTAKF